jgi:hypothetical protein
VNKLELIRGNKLLLIIHQINTRIGILKIPSKNKKIRLIELKKCAFLNQKKNKIIYYGT